MLPRCSQCKAQNGKIVTMSQLKVGDQVQTGIKSTIISELTGRYKFKQVENQP